tara:strand:+ start:143 stop:550 length:408 start_codon:yes stop_codon:yes gene_type:complete
VIDFKKKSHRIKILSTIFILSIIYVQFVYQHFTNEKKSEYLYTELQKSHLENGKYKRDGILWTDRKSTMPLSGLVYDFAENGKRIDFGMLVDGHQDGIWRFFHENGVPSMENIYEDGEFIRTTKRWDSEGNEIEL